MKPPLDFIRERQGEISFILFAAACVTGVCSQAYAPARLGDEMWRLADHLATNGVFADPFGALATGPTAANPPLCPLLLAALIKLFRVPWIVFSLTVFASILANAIVAIELPRVSRIFYGSPVPGTIASVLWLCAMENIPGWDTNFTVLTLLWFCMLTSRFADPAKRLANSAPANGLLAGMLFLFNPSSLLIVIPWLAFLVWQAKANRQRALAYSGTVVALMSLFVIGWGERNEVELGSFTVRTNLGMTLYASNNDCAQSSMIRDLMNGCYQSHHPNSSRAEAEYLFHIGEVRYDKNRTADAETWMRAHPDRFIRLTAARILEFWFPPAEIIPGGYVFSSASERTDYARRWMRQQHIVDYAIWVVTGLSIPGLMLMAMRRNPLVVFLLTVFAIYPLLYYVVVSDVRYRYPILWLSLLPAGYFVCEALTIVTRSEKLVQQEYDVS